MLRVHRIDDVAPRRRTLRGVSSVCVPTVNEDRVERMDRHRHSARFVAMKTTVRQNAHSCTDMNATKKRTKSTRSNKPKTTKPKKSSRSNRPMAKKQINIRMMQYLR